MIAVRFAICLLVLFVAVGSVFADNVALNKPAWATAEIYGTAASAVDGIPSAGGHCWNSGVVGTPSNPVVLFVDLQNVYSVNQINLYADPRYIVGQYENYNLRSSIDNASWTLIESGSLVSTSYPWPKILQFDPISVRYLRFEGTGGTLWTHLYEMEVYDVPEPATMLLLGLGGMLLRKRVKYKFG